MCSSSMPYQLLQPILPDLFDDIEKIFIVVFSRTLNNDSGICWGVEGDASFDKEIKLFDEHEGEESVDKGGGA